MAFDLSSLPVSGSALIGMALYAGASVLAGQEIGARMIERSGWHQNCAHAIQDHLTREERPRREMPPTDCNALIGRFHPELQMLCWEFGNPDLGGPAAEARRQAERARERLAEERRQRAWENAGSRCTCAANDYLQSKLLPLGLYAGTARFVSVPAVEDQHGTLVRALNGPVCAANREIGG